MKLKFIILSLSLTLIFAACQSAEPTATPVPTVPALQGTVNIITPSNGSVIYAEALWVAGESDSLPDDGFVLRVSTQAGDVLAETSVQPIDGTWQVEIVHGYTGDPTQLIVSAHATDERIIDSYDSETISIAPLDFRPDGVFGSIVSPQDGDTPGGDEILVIGTASGVFENSFALVLEEPDGTEISSVIVTMTNPYFIDEMLWEASLPTNEHTGPATIRAYAIDAADGSEIPLGEVDVMMSRVAG